MSAVRVAAIALIVAGGSSLFYGALSYTHARKAELGPIELTVRERKTVDIPVWLGLGVVLAGGLMLVVPRRGI